MRTGLDFAWSKPSVADIQAGGYSFVLRYLSRDHTGKNLTRAEADTYRAAGIDICSNWEYAANAAANGYGQGVADATDAAAQHTDCGGPPDAPIEFSVDFNPTTTQMIGVDAYFVGVASVIGLSRIGAYGGYKTIAHLFDIGRITYGWQTYAWSLLSDNVRGPHSEIVNLRGQLFVFDTRAQLRQVLNGITVGGADCDLNEAHADNFGQWNAPKEDGMRALREDDGTIYLEPGTIDAATGRPELWRVLSEEAWNAYHMTYVQLPGKVDWNAYALRSPGDTPPNGGGAAGPSAAEIAKAVNDDVATRMAG